MVEQGCEFSFFRDVHVGTDIRIDISICITPNDCQFGQAGTSRGVDSNETNQAGDGDVITSRLRDKLKAYLHYHSVYDHQPWQDGNLF